MIRGCFIVLAIYVPIFLADDDVFRIVQTDLGDIRGNVQKTLLNKREFFSFRGIRYARPPIGELRFKVSNQHLSNSHAYLNVIYELF